MRVAVIGAGISGCAFASWLVEERRRRGLKIEVMVFDKGRRPGGRASSKPSPKDEKWEADFGAISFKFDPQIPWRFGQALTDDQSVARVYQQLLAWIESGTLASVSSPSQEVKSRLRDHWIAPHGMGRFVAEILEEMPEIQLLTSHQIKQMSREVNDQSDSLSSTTWSLTGTKSPSGILFREDEFDFLVVTAPPPQAANLLKDIAPSSADRLSQVQAYPQWVARFRGDLPWLTDPILEVDSTYSESIARVSAEGLKRGQLREKGNELYCVQATPSWSRRYLEHERDDIGALLMTELEKLGAQLSQDPISPQILSFERAHRWRFSGFEVLSGGVGADFDLALGLGCCGDSYYEGQLLGALYSASHLLTLYQDSW